MPRLFDGPQRGQATHADGRERLREEDQIAHRHDGQGVGRPWAQRLGLPGFHWGLQWGIRRRGRSTLGPLA